jgi:hypothetical protein
MKTKSLLFAAASIAAAVLLMPSQAQAGGHRKHGYRGYNTSRDCGYVNYRNDCYAPVVRQVRIVRPVRAYRRVNCAPAPLISIGFGFGGGRCY